jgi:hypothetical protein
LDSEVPGGAGVRMRTLLQGIENDLEKIRINRNETSGRSQAPKVSLR